MSGQIDAGWAATPFGVDRNGGDIRIVLRGADVAAARDETTRVIVAHAAAPDTHRDADARYLAACRETLDRMYATPDAIPARARFAVVFEARGCYEPGRAALLEPFSDDRQETCEERG